MDTNTPTSAFGATSLLSTSLLLVAPPTPTDLYGQACSRIEWQTGSVLSADMAAALRSLLSVIQTFLINSDDPTPHPLLAQVASREKLSDEALSTMAQVVKTGLEEFAAASGYETAPESRRAFLQAQCKMRDNNTCCLTRCPTGGECYSIFPFDKGDGVVNFWQLIALLCGEEETAALRIAISIDRDMHPDRETLSNFWWISTDLHKYFANGWVVVVPQLTIEQLPYDPAAVREYSAIIEFPFGWTNSYIPMALSEAGQHRTGSEMLRSGDTIRFRTSDAKTMPLPHPAMFQLHAMVSRIMAKKAAAGYPVMLPDKWNTENGVGDVGGGSRLTEELTHGTDEGNYTTHGLPVADKQAGKVEGRVVSPPSSISSQPFRPPPLKGRGGNQQLAPDKSRLVELVNAEYPARMAEMYDKMTEVLGRKVDGDMWWTKDGDI